MYGLIPIKRNLYYNYGSIAMLLALIAVINTLYQSQMFVKEDFAPLR